MSTNQELGSLVDKITTSGRKDIDPEQLKKLKEFCKQGGDAVITQIFHMITYQMSKNHSQIRYSTLLLVDELFKRSHKFRTLLLHNDYLSTFIELTLGTNDDKPLPPPKAWASDLKKKSIECIDIWYNKFKEGYPSLDTLYNHFSRNCIDFRQRQVIRLEERREIEAEQERQKQILQRKMDKVNQEFYQIKETCDTHLVNIFNCFQLLYPGIQKEDIFCEDELFEGTRAYLSLTKSDVPVTVRPYIEIVKDKDNEHIIHNLKDVYHCIVRNGLPKIKELLKEMAKGPDFCKQEMKQAIDLKSQLMIAIQKFIELKIIDANEKVQHDNSNSNEEENSNSAKTNNELESTDEEFDNDDDDDNDCFEEVQEKEGLELIIPQHRRKEYGLDDDPIDSDKPSSSRSTSGLMCKVPLPTGKLCPRRDAKKCPFHGIIIPRDETGEPINEEDRKKLEIKKPVSDVPEWQDPEYLKDLEAQLGIDLTVKKKGKGKSAKTKLSNLQDIKTCDQTPRKRLKKKIFTKEARERLAKDLDSIDEKRSRQFEDQWNYALQS